VTSVTIRLVTRETKAFLLECFIFFAAHDAIRYVFQRVEFTEHAANLIWLLGVRYRIFCRCPANCFYTVCSFAMPAVSCLKNAVEEHGLWEDCEPWLPSIVRPISLKAAKIVNFVCVEEIEGYAHSTDTNITPVKRVHAHYYLIIIIIVITSMPRTGA